MLKLALCNLKKLVSMQASKGSQPYPFGGQIPTRIAIDVRWGRRPNERWQYVGKPSIYAIHALNKRMRFRGAAAKYWEFDRKGQLLYAHCQPGANRLRVQNYNSTLVAVYHHWNQLADPFLGFTAPFWMKKVQGRWIYSPFEHLKLDTHLRPYKTWLADALAINPKAILKQNGTYRFEARFPAPLDNDWLRPANVNMAERLAMAQVAPEPPQPTAHDRFREILRRAGREADADRIIG